MKSTYQRKSIGKRLRFEVLKRDHFTCQYCGAHGSGVILHVDHVTPVAAGGATEIDNLATACDSCNLGKSDRPLSMLPIKGSRLALQVEQAAILRASVREMVTGNQAAWEEIVNDESVRTPGAEEIIHLIARYSADVAAMAVRGVAREVARSPRKRAQAAGMSDYLAWLVPQAKAIVGKRVPSNSGWKARVLPLLAEVAS